jgi:RNA polymerase sigma-70 factor (ECF subfamily)
MRLQGLDDAYLVSRARAGRLDAFEELVRGHRDRVYRVALRMLGERRDAEDAAQDVLLQAWRSLEGFRADSSFSTWVYRITVNRCLNVLQVRHDNEPLMNEHASAAPPTEAIVESRLQLDDVRRAILRLTPEQRAPLVCASWARVREEAATASRDDAGYQLPEDVGEFAATDDDETTTELPTMATEAAATGAPPTSSAAASETEAEHQRPTPSRLRDQLEEAGWPTFDDG